MKAIVVFAAAILLISCSNSPLVSPLEGSDSLSIRFGQPGSGLAEKMVATTQTGAIKAVLLYVDGEQTGQLNCAYDGHILFYRKGSLAGDISFNFSGDGCHHFLHQVNGKPVATKMSNEAVDFLISLEKVSQGMAPQ